MFNKHKKVQEIVTNYQNNLLEPDPGWPYKIQVAKEYINTHLFKEGLTVTDIKNECYITERCFASKFKMYLGYYPKEYILINRINLSKRLLKIDGLAIVQVALTVGFSSHSAFCKTFKNRVGTKPSKWRKRVVSLTTKHRK